ncbi:LETM1 domain-containing protein ylh47 [Taxawa tesnikishii (nom. ined.)]|nr:LETM1 domain-containing protein ylh47 [Dothideales sp. JES 119]
MSFNRTASQLAPLILRNGVPILVPHRGYATETSTSSGANANYPPPGFNAEQAKKPLPKETQSSKPSSQPAKESSRPLPEINIPTHEPSVHPPTKAAEDRALNELAVEKKAEDKAEEKAMEKKEEEKKKLSLRQKIMKEVHHYWDGTKLLAAEVKISSKLALKMAAGYELTRREHRQLTRTVQDLGRLVPFSVFVIVPFAELLLPVALKLFPNMLPSTYEGQKSREAKATSLRATRKDVSNFLRSTLRETGLPVSAANAQREEFTEFFRKIRTTGESPSKADVIRVCKIFKDDLTLDNLSRPQLVGICRYMNLGTFGTDAMLRYTVRHRMRQIKRDDRAISFEGVDSLSVPELQTACASRGLRTHGVSPVVCLRLKYGVPSTLLVLSNAFMYAQGKEQDYDTQIDALQAVLSSIPEELFHEIELEVHTAEGAATNKQRLEVLREQQELIEEENEQSEKQKEGGKEARIDDRENIDEAETEGRQDETLKKENDADAQAKKKEGEEVDAKEVRLDNEATEDAPKPAEDKKKEYIAYVLGNKFLDNFWRNSDSGTIFTHVGGGVGRFGQPFVLLKQGLTSGIRRTLLCMVSFVQTEHRDVRCVDRETDVGIDGGRRRASEWAKGLRIKSHIPALPPHTSSVSSIYRTITVRQLYQSQVKSKATTPSLSTIAYVLASLTAGGGTMGYARTGSVPSIAAGCTVGALYALGGYRIANRQPYGVELGLLASVVLAGSSVPRAIRSGKPLPIGLSLLAAYGLFNFGMAWQNRVR